MTATSPSVPRRARARAPGSIGNVGPGLDMLGCAITGDSDSVEASWSDSLERVSVRITESGHPELPDDPTRHAAAIAAAAVLREAKHSLSKTLLLSAHKGLPLAGGQGGSAASAVAGAAAVNALLGSPLDRVGVLRAALEAETHVAGRHADNVAPALFGGIVLIRALDPLDVVPLPVPHVLRVVLALPDQRLRTADARAVLPTTLDRALALRQGANVAAMVAALYTDDLELLRRALDDRIAEPARAPLLPGFAEAKAAALAAGAIGCSISGAGPTSFAFASDDAVASRVGAAMRLAYAARGVKATARVERIDTSGAKIEVE